ncbi:MAG TPA: hypothetical protein VGD45_30355 [Steroidobacter sp.]|uniref:hypothetical protein n=1 Tax=Steroidobacter sp. TaxID=1978227 RepID=UPI002EDB5414
MKYSVLLVLLTLAGCMAQPTVTSWLDPVSVATITSQTEPLVLMRGSGRINQRKLAQLTAIEVNRMGARRLYLVLIPRSTGDVTYKQQTSFESSFQQIKLRMDDRSLALTQYTGNLAELGIGQPALPLPIDGSAPMYFPIERDDLRAMAASSRIELTALGLPKEPQLYEEWKDGRRSLSDFLSQLPAESSTSPRDEAP